MNTNTQSSTLVALFDDYSSAQRAARELEAEGVPQNAISIQSNQMTAGAGSYGPAYTEERHEGGFGAWLRDLFGGDSDDDHSHYDEALRRGNAVVTVNLEGQSYENAIATLNRNGAVDVNRRAESWRQSGYTGYDQNAQPFTGEQSAAERDRIRGTEQAGPVPVIEEELQVGKRVVQKGGVRVYSRVIDRPVEEQVNLREEHVRVERRPVNRPVTDAELGGLRDQTIEVTQMAEEPVVSKRARVTEEVVVGKEATERTETIRDNVRHTEVTVDSLDAGQQQTAGSTSTTGTTESAGASDYSQFGSRYANDSRFHGLTWDNAEQDVRTDYLRSNPNSSWDDVRAGIRSGWEKARGGR